MRTTGLETDSWDVEAVNPSRWDTCLKPRLSSEKDKESNSTLKRGFVFLSFKFLRLEDSCFLASCSTFRGDSVDAAAAGIPSGDEDWNDDQKSCNRPGSHWVIECHQYHDEHERY